MKRHNWSGWPGAFCLDCREEDPRERCLADHEMPDCECCGGFGNVGGVDCPDCSGMGFSLCKKPECQEGFCQSNTQQRE